MPLFTVCSGLSTYTGPACFAVCVLGIPVTWAEHFIAVVLVPVFSSLYLQRQRFARAKEECTKHLGHLDVRLFFLAHEAGSLVCTAVATHSEHV